MFSEKIKKYIDDLSTIKFLGFKDFIIIDVNEMSVKLVHIKTNNNPLNILNAKIPKHNIISQRSVDVPDGNLFELNREIRIISDRNKLQNVVLVLVFNNYKSFNIALNKEGKEDGDESNVSELIKAHLPQNISSSDFIIQYEKISDDENFDNYVVTVTRSQELQKFNEIINNDIFQLKFAIPSIFLLTNEANKTEQIDSLIEVTLEKSVHYQITKDQKASVDEYYNKDDGLSDIQNNITQIITSLPSSFNENDEGHNSNIVFCADVECSVNIPQVISEYNNANNVNIHHSISNYAKHQLAYLKCLNDKILNLNIDDLLAEKQKFDIERHLTNRSVIGAFGLIMLLLLILNVSNLFIDNSISEISEQKEDKKTIELQVNQLDKKNNQLKADIRSLSNLKNGNQKISHILKIISESYIEQMSLTDLRLIKTESNNIDIKLNGESASKNEVINFIKNLESNKNLYSIELVGMNKNNEILNDGLSSKYDYKFSISMKFNDNKKS